ncbi:MAG: P1 family peptidase [Xanthomonadales bacterium]|nr:P1 family peptidase [Xanthomonadales bacterium]
MKKATCLQVFWLAILCSTAGMAQTDSETSGDGPVRARDLGIPFDGVPGPLNAITDVAGVTVGHRTLIEDLDGGRAVRTGVTAILPRGRASFDEPVFAGTFSLNGNGEMTGTIWVEESGMLEGPVMITNTHSVGVVHDAVIQWRVQQAGADDTGYWWSLPVVAETWDGYLNDINGFHVKPEHAHEALEAAAGGPVAEGGVGGGTGMIAHEFKGGIGTASRVVSGEDGEFTLGVLVQANYGLRDLLRIAGAPVGKHLQDHKVYTDPALAMVAPQPTGETGSITIGVATDAPLLPHQLTRLARRAALGLARNGSVASNGSGDIFIAFSTANAQAGQAGPATTVDMLTNDRMNGLFVATVEATEEAIVNAMVAAEDMRGDRGHLVKAIPHAELQAALKRYNRLDETAAN